MRVGKRVPVAVAMLVLALLRGEAVCRQLLAAGEEPGQAVLLDAGSLWRCHFTWNTEVVRQATGDLEFATVSWPWGEGPGRLTKAGASPSPAPPPGWTLSDFDDGAWARARGPFDLGPTRTLSLLCLRGKFGVSDPAKATALTLSMTFRGGAAVYVNGQELTRSHLPAGALAPDTPAEDYPAEAYVDPDGFLLRWVGFGDPEKYKDRFALRERRLSNVRIPASALRKGVNVVAVEVHRAPTAEVLFSGRPRQHTRSYTWWSMAGVGELKLTADAGAAVVPNVGRPRGTQVWTQPIIDQVHAPDYGDPFEQMQPVRIRGARNGVFSGQVVVGSTEPIRGLKATVSDLVVAHSRLPSPSPSPSGRGDRGEGPPRAGADRAGLVPASAVTVRYALPDGPRPSYRPPPAWFDGLADEPPVEVSVDPRGSGAVQPIWVTVRVPLEAAAGDYEGALTIAMEGVKPVVVPVNLQVADWVLPDTTQFVTHVGLIQSPDTLAIKYNVPTWSEAHWQLIERSFDWLGQVGTKVVYIPVLRRTYFGNEHSMVRWVRQPGGSFTHDFSLVERYLNVAVKHLGKVPVVCIYCWDVNTGSAYMGGGNVVQNAGMPFTILDPATGALEEAVGPTWGSPEIRGFWKPVMEGLRKILAERGMAESMMVGVAGDRRPNKEAVGDLRAVAPWAPWVISSHNMPRDLHGQPVGYSTGVWGLYPAPDPATARHYGWRNPFRVAVFPRFGSNVIGHSLRLGSPLAAYREVTEAALTSRATGEGLRGVGRCGADFWHVLQTRGESSPISGRYPETNAWHGGWLHNAFPYILSPGTDGAIATARFEALREGVQESEARIFIEKALTDPALRTRLGDDLAARAQTVLDERVQAIRRAIQDRGSAVTWAWFAGSGWEERSARLYAAAAEVAAKVGT